MLRTSRLVSMVSTSPRPGNTPGWTISPGGRWAAFPPYPYPSGGRSRPLEAILRPVTFPKYPEYAQNRPLRAVPASVAP